MPTNIDRFNVLVAQILALLYREFPIRQSIRAENLLGYQQTDNTYSPEGRWTAEYRKGDGTLIRDATADFDFVQDTIRWLSDEGYILHWPYETGYEFMGVTLSAKGLELLKAVPSSVAGSTSVGDTLLAIFKDGTKDGAKEAAASAISSALTQAPGFLMSLR
ncbi:MAG: hypothetical protein IPO67_31850 [Deltaproteobacteria bacterium]|nr:hypothetical protein [Deltaproteobacteria bacterium]